MNHVMLCVATAPYNAKYAPLLYQQYTYCKKHNIDYVLITDNDTKFNSKWLKIWKAKSLLEKSKYLIVIDADIHIDADAPNILEQINPDMSMHVCLGVSNRVNSGMLVLKNNNHAKNFLNDVLKDRKNQVSKDDFVTADGENGHVIKFCRKYQNYIELLPSLWNNTVPEVPCFFRHYANYSQKEYVLDHKKYYDEIKKKLDFINLVGEKCAEDYVNNYYSV